MTGETTSDNAAWLEKASVLADALPFMRAHAGETVVVKYGGHAMGDESVQDQFAKDIVLLKQVGINPIVVHGGGPQIGAMLDRLKIKSEFIDGLRVTDAATVEIVEMVLCSNIEKILDLGFVGEPSEINPHILDTFEESDIIPVIAPIGVGPNGETYNINADTVAGAVAGAAGASRLLMLTDVAGVLDDTGRLIKEMTLERCKTLIQSGTISGGMIPKVETCMDAVEQGVEAAVIVDGRVPHAVLLELFTPSGAGTLIRSR